MSAKEMSDHKATALAKFLETILSVKFYLLIISSFFLYIGKLDQVNWMYTVLTVAGFRTINEVATIAKGSMTKSVTAQKAAVPSGKSK